MVKKTDVLIIGAGAAGLICAAEAGRRGRKVCVVDHSEQLGGKILMSGGGLCNFTNRNCGVENFISENPRFCMSALARFGPQDFIELLENEKIEYEERGHGRLFCRRSAEDIVKMLERQCRKAGVEFFFGCTVAGVEKKDSFTVKSNAGEFCCSSLVIATGGISYPQAKASDFGHRIARQFGLAVTQCSPGLVGLTFNYKDKKLFDGMAGISLEAKVSCCGKDFEEEVLVTHSGLSGPAILQASNYWQKGTAIKINWLPKVDILKLLMEGKQQKGAAGIKKILFPLLPNRFAVRWLENYFCDRKLQECSKEQIQKIADALGEWKFVPSDTEGYKKAEATIGGVDTGELSSKTMESKKIAGLYFIGEVMDVAGQLGGYNLQWAWSSGYAAGTAV